MKRSTDKILTTHAGSLPRPQDLLDMMQAQERGVPVETRAFASRVTEAVSDIVKKQRTHGIDVVDDGEQGKPSFVTYVNSRLAGFERAPSGGGNPWAGSREYKSFPEFYDWITAAQGGPSAERIHMVCTGPVRYKGQEQVKADIANLKAAVRDSGAADAFIPAISPTNIEGWQKNLFYKSDEEYIHAIADAMREEYKAITDAGLLLQIDDPRFATYYVMNPDKSLEECRRWAEIRVEALNQALRGIPEDQVRFHTCYSINMGPRIHDMALKDMVDIMLKIRAGAYSFEAANPRHEHEWRLWQEIKLAEGKSLIPGVITHTSHLVEHPELVADRIVRFAEAVGRENVIAGADCGFSTFASSCEIHPTVAWAKFDALAEGARLATKQLWGRA